MQLSIIKVGNSKGLRLPKTLLEEYQIEDAVELSLKDGYIELRPAKNIRKNWKEQLEQLVDDPNEEDRITDFFEDEEL